jgi:hypothetical protein
LECINPNHPGQSPRKGQSKQVGIKNKRLTPLDVF